MIERNILNEQSLVKSLRKGNIEAFNALFERYSQKVYGFALRYLKDETEAEGVVQDVFMYIWNNRSGLKTDTNFRSYLFTISINLIRKAFRREAYRIKYMQSAAFELADNSIDEKLEYASLLEEVDKLIDKLPERRRNIFIKSRKLGMSSKEIAKELGISPASVDNQISEAIKFLRTRIKSEILVFIFVLNFIW